MIYRIVSGDLRTWSAGIGRTMAVKNAIRFFHGDLGLIVECHRIGDNKMNDTYHGTIGILKALKRWGEE